MPLSKKSGGIFEFFRMFFYIKVMIVTATKRILIVPDFGIAEAAEHLLPLMEAIKRLRNFDAKIIDLRQMVIDENPDKKLKEVQILDLAARRLDALAADKSIVWDKPIFGDDFTAPDLSSYETEPEPENNHGEPAGYSAETKPEPEEERIIRKDRLTIRVSRTSDDHLMQAAPNVIVIFGKSVMLAGGIKDVPVLIIDPVYDEEWPWRKRYYIDRKETDSLYDSFLATMNATHNPKVLHYGCEIEYRRKQPQRFCLLTDRNDSDEFSERYPRLAMSDPELSDPEKLAEAIEEFTQRKLETPLIDIYEMLKIPARGNTSKALKFSFQNPVEVEGHKATAILLEGFSPYRMSGEVVLMESPACNRSLEDIHDKQALLRLREAMAETVKTMPPKKRILIVPDLLTPKDSPIATMLRDELLKNDHYVALFESGAPLKSSRKGLERRCKSKPFDLIVTIETGCLLVTRVINAPRIFVNPDWTVWKDMKKCGYEREEWETARTMGMKANIRRDGPHWAMGWFTPDQIDGEVPQEHIERFGSAGYPPRIDMTNKDGIRELAWEINKTLM